MDKYEREKNILGHMKYHKVKEWLLRGCKREDANTIREAVERTSEREIIKALARAIRE